MIQWFVEPEARVEEFDKLCEVQSDKASVEVRPAPHPLRLDTPKTGLTVTAQITSRYEGVVKTLHYQAGDMAIVGKARLHTPPPRDAIANTTLGTLRH